MINELKVFYNSEKGLMAFNNKKTIFQHREERENVDIGLGILVENTLSDKGNYAFAVFKNIETVVPEKYYTISFFSNRGVPLKIEKGYYGKNIFIKETYRDRTYIRAYKVDGSVGLYESKTIKNVEYDGPNVYFNRLDDLITSWEDITDIVVTEIIKSIDNLTCTATLTNDFVLSALKGLGKNIIYQLDSGVIVAEGKFESLIIWTEGSEVQMCWLGRKFPLENLKYVTITDELIDILANLKSE